MRARDFEQKLYQLSRSGKQIFSMGELYLLLEPIRDGTFRTALSRYTAQGILIRLRPGLYLYSRYTLSPEEILFQTAGQLRKNYLWYLSLESVLSQAGIISQIPIDTITCMTTGRSGNFIIGSFGRVEFVHTKRSVELIFEQLHYDDRRVCYVASVEQALADLKATGRSNDLINPEVFDEYLSKNS